MDKPNWLAKEPIRLFKSDFLEFFSHVHPAAVLVVWVPLTGLFLYLSFSYLGTGLAWNIVPCLLCGLHSSLLQIPLLRATTQRRR